MSKSKELLDILDDYPVFEMANIPTEDTGLSYIIHIRTKLETPGHPNTASLKVYQHAPINSDSFGVIISNTPSVKGKHKLNKFYRSLKSKDKKDILKWVSINHLLLLDFYNNGMSWNIKQIYDWSQKLKKI